MVEITQTRNARSLNTENTMFDVEIRHPVYDWIPYTLNPADTDETINNDDLRTLIGDDFAAYVPPTQEELDAEASVHVRYERDMRLLQEVDPIVSNPLRWADMTTKQQNAWSQYLTDLLNHTEPEDIPNDVTRPTTP